MADRLTLEDIAQHAGSYQATVSWVLGRHPERHDVDLGAMPFRDLYKSFN